MINRNEATRNFFEEVAERRNITKEEVRGEYQKLAILIMNRIKDSDN